MGLLVTAGCLGGDTAKAQHAGESEQVLETPKFCCELRAVPTTLLSHRAVPGYRNQSPAPASVGCCVCNSVNGVIADSAFL